MKVAVLGSGVLGSNFGGFLKYAGHDVTLIDPFKDHMDAIAESGLTVTDTNLNEQMHFDGLKTATSAEGLDPVDVVLVMVKGCFSRVALDSAKNLIGKDTYLVSFQNGLGNDDILAEYTDRKHIITGVVVIMGRITSPGNVTLQRSLAGEGKDKAHGYMYPVEVTEEGLAVANNLAESFGLTGTILKVSDRITFDTWSKALIVVSLAPLASITRLTQGRCGMNPYGREQMIVLLNEALAVAEKKGIHGLSAEKTLATIDDIFASSATNHYPSMAQDMLFRKVPTEIETTTGAICRFGREVGVPTPAHDTMYRLIKCVEENYEYQYLN